MILGLAIAFVSLSGIFFRANAQATNATVNFCIDGDFTGNCTSVGFTNGVCQNVPGPFLNGISSFSPDPNVACEAFIGPNCSNSSIAGITFPGIARLGNFGIFQDSISSFSCSAAKANFSDADAFFCVNGNFTGRCNLFPFTSGSCNNAPTGFNLNVSSFTPVVGSNATCTIFPGKNCVGTSLGGISSPGIPQLGPLGIFQDSMQSFQCSVPPNPVSSGAAFFCTGANFTNSCNFNNWVNGTCVNVPPGFRGFVNSFTPYVNGSCTLFAVQGCTGPSLGPFGSPGLSNISQSNPPFANTVNAFSCTLP